MNWHESNCHRPDVECFPGSPTPTCMSCGSTAPEILNADELSRAPPPCPISSASNRPECTWPSSVSWVQFDHNGNIEPVSRSAISQSLESKISTPTITYKPVTGRQIRLLQLSRGLPGDPLHAELQVADLAHHPEYEALSYTWADESGDSSKSKRIYLGRQWNVLPITANCEAALFRLRWGSTDRCLWVDAVCINQENPLERNHQVGIMQYIYATAERVLIYLGKEDSDGRDLAALLSRPYFSRLWVIQEIASARRAAVICGSREIEWVEFHKVSQDIIEDKVTDLPQHTAWLSFVDRPRYLSTREDLYSILVRTSHCRATDPRDKLFAILGLFMDAVVEGLVPNYGISVREVSIGLSAYLLLKGYYDLSTIFEYTLSKPDELDYYPSWALDWGAFQPTRAKLTSSGTTRFGGFGGYISPSFVKPVYTNTGFTTSGKMVTSGVSLARLRAPKRSPDKLFGGAPAPYPPDIYHRDSTSRVIAEKPIENGDEIFLLRESRLLMLLRPHSASDNYVLVSPCQIFYDVSWFRSEGLLWDLMCWNSLLWSHQATLPGHPILCNAQPKWFEESSWDELRSARQMLESVHRTELKSRMRALVWKAVFVTNLYRLREIYSLRPRSQDSAQPDLDSAVAVAQFGSLWSAWSRRYKRIGHAVKATRCSIGMRFSSPIADARDRHDANSAFAWLRHQRLTDQKTIRDMVFATYHDNMSGELYEAYTRIIPVALRMDIGIWFGILKLFNAHPAPEGFRSSLFYNDQFHFQGVGNYHYPTSLWALEENFSQYFDRGKSFFDMLEMDLNRPKWESWFLGDDDQQQSRPDQQSHVPAGLLSHDNLKRGGFERFLGRTEEALHLQDFFIHHVGVSDSMVMSEQPFAAKRVFIA